MCACAPASTTVPSRAVITPELATCGATKAASPAWPTVMLPAFVTAAPGLAGRSNTSLPAMKFCVLIPGALTISPLTSTCAPRENATPAALVMMTLPFALIRPAITEGSGPTTRFSVTALALGWLNCTVCWLPTSKLCQLMAARALD